MVTTLPKKTYNNNLSQSHKMLEKEFKYYLENQSSLVKKYDGKFIAIKGQKVIGSYDSHGEALTETTKKEELGTFIIQHCIPGTDGYTQTFHSRVLFHI